MQAPAVLHGNATDTVTAIFTHHRETFRFDKFLDGSTDGAGEFLVLTIFRPDTGLLCALHRRSPRIVGLPTMNILEVSPEIVFNDGHAGC